MTLKWVAVYDDGKELPQCNADGSEANHYRDIDRVRLREFNVLTQDNRPIFYLVLEPEWRLIWRKRTQKIKKPGEPWRDVVWYILGWQTTVAGKNIQSLVFIGEHGIPIISRGRFKGQFPFQSIEPRTEQGEDWQPEE